MRIPSLALLAAAFAAVALAPPARAEYATVNGLDVYYEMHGPADAAAPPLVLLHGSFMFIPAWGELLPALAKDRRVIAVEAQGHGRTADRATPLSYEQMADDVAALLRHLNVEKADVLGYSMGGATALQVAVRHPDVVRRLVLVSAFFKPDAFYPEALQVIAGMRPALPGRVGQRLQRHGAQA